MSTRGMIATMTIEEATDTDISSPMWNRFYVRHCGPGDVVVMDNLSAHKVHGVRQQIEAAGASCSTCRPTPPT